MLLNSVLSEKKFQEDMIKLTPDSGFDLVAIDYFADSEGQLYFVEHFEKYQDALDAKKDRKNPDEYFILYKGPGGEFLSR